MTLRSHLLSDLGCQHNRCHRKLPLFPYTTLFRSDFMQTSPAAVSGPFRRRRVLASGGAGQAKKRVDRKSTRLNSSHGSSSYAVFCLEKKLPLGTFLINYRGRRVRGRVQMAVIVAI